MSNNKRSSKPIKPKFNPLLVVAVAVAAVAIVIVFFNPNGNQGNNSANVTTDSSADTTTDTANSSADNIELSDGSGVAATLNENGDVVIQIADISENATYYNYDSNGTPMGLFAVKASDGTVRTALNTCQVCNGSPKAYFEQKDDTFQCQNCGNIYSVDMIEQERGGCNPVPIMEDDKTVTDTEIIIPAKFLEDNASKFENWKQF